METILNLGRACKNFLIFATVGWAGGDVKLKLRDKAADIHAHFHALDCGGITARQLGPIAAWGGELIVRCEKIEQLKEIIKIVSADLGVKISGFISERAVGNFVFHMSRLPRRVGVPVPPISDSKQVLDRLMATTDRYSIEAVSKEEEWGRPHARALLGLEEGYFDGRRKNIISNWDTAQDKSLDSLTRTLSTEIGDLQQFGIDIHSFQDAGKLIECLRSKNFATLHTIEEVKHWVGNFAAKLQPAYIYSVDQSKATFMKNLL